MARPPMREWTDDALIQYLNEGVPGISGETAQPELELRIIKRNHESASRMESTTKRMEIATWIILVATVFQVVFAVVQVWPRLFPSSPPPAAIVRPELEE